MLSLYLGGARSGKSRLAETTALEVSATHQLKPVLVATGTAGDAEMQQRISRHQQDRDKAWTVVEEPLALGNALRDAGDNCCIMVDCLTLWVTNCLLHENDNTWHHEKNDFLDTLEKHTGRVFIVSNEVGQGVVPGDALSRRFVDEMGFLHQQVANLCDQVYFVTAGIAQQLK